VRPSRGCSVSAAVIQLTSVAAIVALSKNVWCFVSLNLQVSDDDRPCFLSILQDLSLLVSTTYQNRCAVGSYTVTELFTFSSYCLLYIAPFYIVCGCLYGKQSCIYTVSQKNVQSLACYNFDAHEWILIFFGRNVTNKVGNQKVLYYATSNNLCCCTTWQNAETRKSHISLNWIVLHTQCTCGLSSWKKKLLSVMCLIASNICWGSKISH